ncbi:two-component sensor histidine kinase [Solihabitans fulvus]|uniref:histidine kinase n=1 Tax=Solihabitans fulvus TaxID=1892852 RepID=A0A5B2WUC4_9PSEU|nr:histidine kinase [Solihabitans fulvus]KAA2254474.1 two-component sensor histidine kinase [Solihabitans fulvus]
MTPLAPDRAAAELPGLSWLRDRVGRHPVVTDAALALGVFLLTASRGVGKHDQIRALHPVTPDPLPPMIFAALLCAPLVLRRRYPLSVFGALCVVAAVQEWTLAPVAAADIAVLVALYTVASRCTRRQALIAAGVLEVGVGVVVAWWVAPAIALTAFILMSGTVTAALVLGINVANRRAYLASLEDRAVRAERERDQQAEIATAHERARIAREIHDIVTHNLSVMISLADGAAFAARTGSPDAEGAARQVSDTGRQALGEMHRLLGVLREPGPDGPLAPQPGVGQVDDLLAQVRGAGLDASWTVVGTPFPLPPTAGLAVYRLIQEALTNVLKHARSCTRARVTLRYDQPSVEVEVTDDGHGGPAGPGGGHGLVGMRERAAMFGGELAAEPTREGGWRVWARLRVDAVTESVRVDP